MPLQLWSSCVVRAKAGHRHARPATPRHRPLQHNEPPCHGRCVLDPRDERVGAATPQEDGVDHKLPGRPLLLRAAAGRRRDQPAAPRCRLPPSRRPPHRWRCVLGPRNEQGGDPTRQEGGVDPGLPGRSLLVRAAAGRGRDRPRPPRRRPVPPGRPLHQRRRALGPRDESGGAPRRQEDGIDPKLP